MDFSAPQQQVRKAACAAAVCIFLAGCSGSDGRQGAAGPQGPSGPSGVGVTTEAESLTFTLDSIMIASPPVVDFTLTNERGVRFVGLAQGQPRFTLAKLVPATGGNPSYWQSYINRNEGIDNPPIGPGTQPAIQATSESNGTLVNNGDGTYRYTFATNVTAVTSPLAVSWQPTFTHRLGVQISGGTHPVPVTNATYDWRPSDGATTGIERRDIVQTASCNECHSKLAEHGGGRTETKYCVTCHNPGTVDANSGNPVDFKVMIHKIHRGEFLPSVEAGGEYAIWGNGDTKHDYSHVALPQDIRNCTKCHDAADTATPQGGNWETAMSVEACGSCHDDVVFSGPNPTHSGGTASNGECTVCHRDGSAVAPTVAEAHAIPDKVVGANYALNVISVTNSAPGQFPVITYEVTNPNNGNSRYNIMSSTDPVWTNGSVSILLGWNTADHTNKCDVADIGTVRCQTSNAAPPGNTSAPASSISLNGRASSSNNNATPTANPDGTFTVTSLRVVPADATGSGVAGMTARVGADHDGDNNFTDRVPVKSVVKYFAITDATPVARRSVVDIINNCDDCHDQLTLHGESRTDEPQLCVICHNPRNTDIGRRPKNANGSVNVAVTVDGLKEQSIDFKRMIHGIHSAAKRESPFVIYGFNSSVNDFSTVGFPGVLNNCRACHKADTFTLPLASSVLATSVDTGNFLTNANYLTSQTDDRVTTPTSVVCSTCHDSAVAQTHMEQNGGQFSILVTDVNNSAETCEVCHGAGRTADVSVVHGVNP